MKVLVLFAVLLSSISLSASTFAASDRGRDSHHARDRHTTTTQRHRENHHYQYGRWAHSPAFVRPHYGQIEHRIPSQHIVVRFRNHPYYYHGGLFYDLNRGSYIIVNAPVGALVPSLPLGYLSFGVGPGRYFYFGGTYYVQSGQQYEVVAPPPQAQQIVNTAQQEMIIYPAKGQSQDQLDQDRYQCHVWSVGQTGFDPSANDPDLGLKPEYNRAMGACLEARGYVVK